MLFNLTLQSMFLLKYNVWVTSDKQLKPLLPSCFLLIHVLSLYFDAGLMQVFKELILFKMISVCLFNYTISAEHLSVA